MDMETKEIDIFKIRLKIKNQVKLDCWLKENRKQK